MGPQTQESTPKLSEDIEQEKIMPYLKTQAQVWLLEHSNMLFQILEWWG